MYASAVVGLAIVGSYIHVANYLDGNGIELYWDRPKEEWPRAPGGGVAMVSEPLDLRGLLAEAGG
jgi:catechol-2,3-dioxygenase